MSYRIKRFSSLTTSDQLMVIGSKLTPRILKSANEKASQGDFRDKKSINTIVKTSAIAAAIGKGIDYTRRSINAYKVASKAAMEGKPMPNVGELIRADLPKNKSMLAGLAGSALIYGSALYLANRVATKSMGKNMRRFETDEKYRNKLARSVDIDKVASGEMSEQEFASKWYNTNNK